MAKIKKRKMSKEEAEEIGAFSWSTWECDPSKFDWTYDDDESAYILEGHVIVRTSDGQEVEIRKGDFVTFPKDLSCSWEVKDKIRKHYIFGYEE